MEQRFFAHHSQSHALTVYFNAAISTPSERHGAAFLAHPGCTKDFFYGRFEQ